MDGNQTSDTLLHTAQTKKSYSGIESIIKKALTEYLTLSRMDEPSKYMCNELSISSNFNIRELNPQENTRDRMNVAHIKSSTLEKTKKNIIFTLFATIDEQVQDQEIASAYKKGIKNFLGNITRNNIDKLWKAPSLRKFLMQYKKEFESEKKEDITSFNIRSQVAKILYAKFGDLAFQTDKNPET